jgi:hypothetical protein
VSVPHAHHSHRTRFSASLHQIQKVSGEGKLLAAGLLCETGFGKDVVLEPFGSQIQLCPHPEGQKDNVIASILAKVLSMLITYHGELNEIEFLYHPKSLY